MRMFLLASASAAAIAAAGAANAADFGPPLVKAPPPPPVFSWTGCYAGGHVGWGWGRSTFTDHTPSITGIIDNSGFQRSLRVDQSGAVFGGQLGCDYEFANSFVLGISGSAAGADISGSAIDPFATAGIAQMTAKTNFLADVSGRLGITWGQTLLYGKGGVAWVNNDDQLVGTAYSASAGYGATGAVAGAGIEWAFAPNWSAFLEYDHYFFGTRTVDFATSVPGIAVFPAAVDIKQEIDAVKVGVNYRFNWGAPFAARY